MAGISTGVAIWVRPGRGPRADIRGDGGDVLDEQGVTDQRLVASRGDLEVFHAEIVEELAEDGHPVRDHGVAA